MKKTILILAILVIATQSFAQNAGYEVLRITDGLRAITTPTLIIGSVKNDFLPFKFHAEYLAKQIKKAKLVKLNSEEGHFVYLDECGLPTKVMGVPLCSDPNGIDPAVVHKKLLVIIEDFLKRKL